MNLHRTTIGQPLRHLWWLCPARLFALVIGSTMLLAALQTDAAYRLYGAPKFISSKHLLLAAVVIGAFAVGRRLAAVTGAVPRATARRVDSIAHTAFWITTGLTVLGYAVWLAVGVKNGFRPALLREFLISDDFLLAETIRDDMFIPLR